jgi:cytochrome P450
LHPNGLPYLALNYLDVPSCNPAPPTKRLNVDAVVGRSRLVSELDLPWLTFLNAAIKETFHLQPTTPFSLPRVAADEWEVAGYRIPRAPNCW